jgi:predicted site-specific integrase-resolvase
VCEEQYTGGSHLYISDLGSGLNYHKKGLQQLLSVIIHRQVDVLVLNHKDRLLRFGAEIIFTLCSFNAVKVEIVETAVIELITDFCARLYGKRSHRNKENGSATLALQS